MRNALEIPIFLGTLLVVLALTTVPSSLRRAEQKRIIMALNGSLDEIDRAGQAFLKNLTNSAHDVDSVSLGTLVSGGYISSNAVGVLSGKATTVYLDRTSKRPDQVRVRVDLGDGTEILARADGRIERAKK